jgi:beta-galactosidase GanA
MASPSIPCLRRTANSSQLSVDGKPFLILGGELQNSSASSSEYMSEVWDNLAATSFNTILASVSWEQIEPHEGVFDFVQLDRLLVGARQHGLRLVLLWFGSFKNG